MELRWKCEYLLLHLSLPLFRDCFNWKKASLYCRLDVPGNPLKYVGDIDEYNQVSEPKVPGKRSRSAPADPVEEYRLVPVREAEPFDEDEKIIDLVGVARDLWDHRGQIVRSLLLFLILGAFVYIFSERIYYAETSLMPENLRGSNVSRLLQQYQGILGIQLDSGDPEGISVNLYPRIIESLPFQAELLQHPVRFESLDREITLYEYLTQVREETFFQKAGNFLWSITFGLPSTLRSLFSSAGGEEYSTNIDFSRYRNPEVPLVVDPGVRRAAREMEQAIAVRIEPQTGFILIGVSLPDAHASAQAVEVVKTLLQEYVTRYRTEKATLDMLFIQEQYEDALKRFRQAQDSLAAFQDRNQNLTSASIRVQEQRLLSQYDLTYDLYRTMATRLEEARIKVQMETPVFTVHEPVTVPTRPASPRANRIVAGSIFLGVFFGILQIYLRRGWRQFFNEFRQRPRAFNEG